VELVQNLHREISAARNDTQSKSTLYIMLINIGFLLIIITVGLGLILFIAIGERKHEFATIMARGAESKQIAVLIVGEAFSITLVGVVIGLFSGLFTAYTFNRILSSNSLFGIGGSTLSGRPLVIEWYVGAIVIFAVIILMLTSIVAALKAKRIKIHQALRIRGG
jgi:putative ABC transport system permease protein